MENVSFQELFPERNNIVPCQGYRNFNSQKYIQLPCVRTLNAIPRKSTLKSIFSFSYLGIDLKLQIYVLGTKNKLLIEPNFDLGLKSENIEF